MSKYLVETYYTCTFKVNHRLDNISEADLKSLEKRDDGEFEILDVKLDNRKTKSLDPNNKKILKNTIVRKIKFKILFLTLFLSLNFYFSLNSATELEGNFTEIKVLDKISSKNKLVKLENGIEIQHKDLSIKSMKCKNSEFDDNPEITAYIQVKDKSKKNKDDVFVFNGWMFSSSPSIAPFDHPVYDIWLVRCY